MAYPVFSRMAECLAPAPRMLNRAKSVARKGSRNVTRAERRWNSSLAERIIPARVAAAKTADSIRARR